METKQIKIIDCILNSERGLSLTQLVNKIQLPKTSIYRALNNMVDHKLLYRQGRNYYLGTTMLRWMNSNLSKQNYMLFLEPYLLEISNHTEQTVHLVQKQGNMGVYLCKKVAKGSIQMQSQVGHELQLYSTGAGKAILSILTDEELRQYLAECHIVKKTEKTIADIKELKSEISTFRKQGYSMEIEQNEKDIQCIGIAFRWAELIFAISITSTTLISYNNFREMGDFLHSKKREILQGIGIT